VAAFRIPNLLRDLFAEGAFSAAFVPTFSRVLKQEGRPAAFALLNRVLGVFVPVLSVICILGMIFTPQIALLISGGVEQTPGKVELLILLARWMFPFLLLISLAAAFMGTLNSLDKFGLPALAPGGFNLGVIIGAVILSRWANPPLLALAWGVLLGGLLQWVVQAVLAHRMGYRFAILSGWRDSNVRQVLKLMAPALIGIAAVQINIFAITRFAWTLGDGPVAYLNFAYRIIFLPLGVFAVAAATVGLPRLSQQVAAGEIEEARRTFLQAAKTVAYLVIPTAIAFILLAEPICAALYQRGRFDALDSLHTARALSFYALGVPAMATVRITAPLFYAHSDTRTPALCGVAAVVSNLIGMSLLVGPLGYAGLALSVALSSIIQVTALWLIAERRYGPLRLWSLARHILPILIVGVLAVAAGWAVWGWLPFADAGWGRVSGVTISIFIAAALYLGITWLIGYRELGGRWRYDESRDRGAS
jgi:putative peptidoglycan lipid II flippase